MNSCFEIVGDYQSENKKIFDPHKVFEVLEKNKSSHFEQLGIPATQKLLIINVTKPNPDNEVIFAESKFPFRGKFSLMFTEVVFLGKKILYTFGAKGRFYLYSELISNKTITFVFSHGLVCVCNVAFRSGISDNDYEELKKHGYPYKSIPCLMGEIEKYIMK